MELTSGAAYAFKAGPTAGDMLKTVLTSLRHAYGENAAARAGCNKLGRAAPQAAERSRTVARTADALTIKDMGARRAAPASLACSSLSWR